MFRGGDYYDDPKFSNPVQIRNNMDISVRKQTTNYRYKWNIIKKLQSQTIKRQYGGFRQTKKYIEFFINGQKPPLPGMSGQRSSNAYGAGVINNAVLISQNILIYIADGGYGNQNDQSKIAGSRYRPRTGERGMADIFQTQQQSIPQKIENRSLVTNDITGAQAKRNYIQDPGMIAGVRTGSPARKNDSSVFSHLPDIPQDRDILKRKDVEISKPRIVSNNLSTNNVGAPSSNYGGYASSDVYGGGANSNYDYLQQQIQLQNQQQSQGNQMAGVLGNQAQYGQDQASYTPNNYQQEKDDVEKQYQEYLMQKQKEAALNYTAQLNQQPVNGLSGFTKNQGGSNILAHDFVDVRAKGNLASNGSQIFNNGGYSASSVSRRMQKEAQFEQNFQKPMADRNASNQDYLKNNQLKTAAGGNLSMNSTAKRVSVNDGKERLFGAVEEGAAYAYQRQGSQAQDNQIRTGKRILNSGGGSGVGIGLGGDSHSNVIGGYPSSNQSVASKNQGYPQSRIQFIFLQNLLNYWIS